MISKLEKTPDITRETTGETTSRVQWKPSYRLIPSRFPPVGLFDRVANAADLEAVFAIEALTNDRLRNEAGDIQLVPKNECIVGPGTTPIMAAFTHLNPEGSRFSDGTFGVYYAAHEIETAISETAFHQAKFLARTREPAMELDMRSYLANVDAQLIELRGKMKQLPDIYDLNNYAASQIFGIAQRKNGASGLVYDSVRHAGGTCIAAFRPKVLKPAIQGPHYTYVWDGQKISHWYEKSRLNPLG